MNKVIDTRTGKIYRSVKEVSDEFNIPHSTVRCWINGSRKNYSTFELYDEKKDMINKVILVGNLGSDPKTYTFEDGNMVTNFNLATSEKYTNKKGEKVDNTEWHNVTTYGKTAELATQYLSKGSKIYLEGKIKTSKYEKDGEERYKTEIVANNITFLSTPRDTNKEAEAVVAANESLADDDGLPF